MKERATLMGKLEGKVAAITAATSDMALATAKLFVEEGAHIFITGRRKISPHFRRFELRQPSRAIC
jgi:NAD(P)-dependent dehydrogenase (short-subunit alcohol dehydrogenase family)